MRYKMMISLGLISLFTSCQLGRSHKAVVAKNAILFVGDGMGIAQMTSGRLYAGGSFHQMNYEQFKYTGFSKTYSSDNYTTDSAAGATALAAGVKSYNGAISMTDPKWESDHKSKKLQTLSDLAKSSGKSVGIITTTRITHATPACFYAHVLNRNSESEIAEQVLKSNVDLWIGGGREFFLPKKRGGKRPDERNILDEMTSKGNVVLDNIKDLKKYGNLDKPILALLADSHVGYYQEGKAESSLDQMVKEAVRLLSKNPNGFFLLVEGGRVDHASHINQEEKMMAEMVELDKAIGSVFRLTDSDETLVVLTADHETAGLAINGYGPHSIAKGKRILGKTIARHLKEKTRPIITWSTGPGRSLYEMHSAAHTAVDVPIAAKGPGAENFSGWMDNTEIAIRIARNLGLEFVESTNLRSMRYLNNLKK